MATHKSPSAGNDKDRRIIDRTAESIHESVDQIAEGARRADEKVREQAKRVEAKAEAAVADVRTQSAKLVGETTDFVRTNPLMSVGLALVAGALVHKLFGGK
jgi:ElaB/YqjD/DUF883 family membrane-anchored ribosome-binding protein